MVKSWLAKIINRVWLIFATTVITVAVFFSLARASLPYISYFHKDIESFLTEKLGASVSFASIDAAWEGEGPRLSVENIHVESLDGKQSYLKVKHVTLQLDFWRTLLNARLVTNEFNLESSQIDFDLDSLIFQSASDDDLDSYGGSDFLIDTLLGQNDVDISDIEFHVHSKKKEQDSVITLNRLQITNYDAIHQLSGELNQLNGGKLKLVAELYGDPRLPGSQTKLYLNSHKIELPQLPLIELILAGKLEKGTLSGEIWADWTYEGWQEVFANVHVDPVEFSIKQRQFKYREMNALLVWEQKSSSESLLSLDNFDAIAEDESKIQLGGLQLVLNHGVSPSVHITYADVEPGVLNGVWALMMDEPELQNWFLVANPQLNISHFELVAEKIENDWEITSGFVDIEELLLNKTESTPQLPPLSGKVEFDGEEVFYRFESTAGVLDYRPLFRWPIDINKIKINGRFIKYSEGSFLTFDDVFISTPTADVKAQGNLFFQDNQAAELSVQAEAYNANAKDKSIYLPVDVMDDSLVDYLDNSVDGGVVTLARFNFQTRLVPDMLSQSDTTFEILGYAKNLDFRYQPDWPKLQKLDATLFFNQSSMFIETTKGKLWNIDVKRATAAIKNFSAKVPMLDLDIAARVDHQSVHRFVEESALRNMIGTLLDDIQPAGLFDVSTKLNVPLASGGKLTAKGLVQLNGNAVNIVAADLTAQEVKGKVNFTEKKVWADKIKVNIFGETTLLNLDTEDYDGSKMLTLKGDGKFDIQKLTQWLLPGNSLNLKNASGFQLNGWVCVENCFGKQIKLDIESDLQGAELNISEPLVKNATDVWPAKVTIEQTGENQNILITIDKRVTSSLNFKRNDSQSFAFDYGTITVGEQLQAVELLPKRLILSAQFEFVDLIEWISVINDMIASFPKGNPQSDASINLIGQYSIKQLAMKQLNLNDVKATMSQVKGSDSWKIEFSSNEANGIVEISESQPLKIHLSSLVLPENLLADSGKVDVVTEPDSNTSEAAPDFSNWPEVLITCDDCQLFGISLNKVTAKLVSDKDGLIVKGLVDKGALLTAPFELHWLTQDNSSRSYLGVKFSSNKLGNLLRDWGFKVGIRDSSSQGALGLHWVGAPQDFSLKKMNGGMNIRLSEGYLEEVSDAKARILSLFSLQSLLKRLTLDFKDIYKEGFFYKTMSGDFIVKNGTIFTDQFQIDGNAAEVSVTGMVDLDRQVFDQYASITPKVTSSLPVLAGWMVEPTTGVMVWLLSKIFAPAIDVITNIEYRVVGPWDKPQVIELQKLTREVELTDEQLEAIRQAQSENEESGESQIPQSESQEQQKP